MHNIVAGNNVLVLPQGMIVFKGIFWGDIFPPKKVCPKKCRLERHHSLSPGKFFQRKKLTCVALIFSWYWQFFLDINEGEDIGEGAKQTFFVSNCVVMIPFFQTNDVQGDTDARYMMGNRSWNLRKVRYFIWMVRKFRFFGSWEIDREGDNAWFLSMTVRANNG